MSAEASPGGRPAYPSVLAMSAPLMVSFTMRAAFTFVDTAYAATLGDAAVAAIGLAIPAEFLMIALWVGASTGLTSCLAQAMGARASCRIQQYLKLARIFAWIMVPFFTAVGVAIWLLAPTMDLDPEVASAFKVYGAVLIGGSAFSSFWSIVPDSLVKAHHDTRTTMWAGIASNVVNVTLNTVFVFVFHWGVFGIALSTVIGRFGGLAWSAYKAAVHERRRRAEWGEQFDGALDPRPVRALLSLAVPAALSFGLMAVETGVVNKILAGLDESTAAIAAYSIFYRVAVFVLNPVIAIGVAMLPYVARRYGESDLPGVVRGIREAGVAAYAYALLLVTPLTFFMAPTLARWLAESPLTTDYSTIALRLVPLSCLAGIPFLLCRPVFEGMQRGRPGLVMALVRYLLLAGPAAWFSAIWAERIGYPGLYGVLIGLLVAAAASSIAFVLWLRSSLRRERAAALAG